MGAPKGNKFAAKYTSEDLEKIGNELIKFADDPNEVHWADFCRKRNKCISWLADLARRYPETFGEKYRLANDIMSKKYTNACLFGELNGKPVNSSFGEKYLPIYDTQYKELLKWKASLNKPQDEDKKFTLSEIVKLMKSGELQNLLTQQVDDDKED